MRNFVTARVWVAPVDGLPPAAVLLAWRSDDHDPLVEAFVAIALEVLAAGDPGMGATPD